MGFKSIEDVEDKETLDILSSFDNFLYFEHEIRIKEEKKRYAEELNQIKLKYVDFIHEQIEECDKIIKKEMIYMYLAWVNNTKVGTIRLQLKRSDKKVQQVSINKLKEIYKQIITFSNIDVNLILKLAKCNDEREYEKLLNDNINREEVQ